MPKEKKKNVGRDGDGDGFTVLAAFDFATSSPKIKVWCMRRNGTLFL